MQRESSVGGFVRAVGRGRNLVILAIADVVLFLMANIAYGGGHQHGLRNAVSNVSWVLFLLGVLLLIVVAITALGQLLWRRGRAQA